MVDVHEWRGEHGAALPEALKQEGGSAGGPCRPQGGSSRKEEDATCGSSCVVWKLGSAYHSTLMPQDEMPNRITDARIMWPR